MTDDKMTDVHPPDLEAMGLEGRVSHADHQSLRLWLRLLSCTKEIEAEIRRRLRMQHQMSLARFDYLAQLHRHPEGLSMRALSKYLMVTGGNITGLTDDLEREGLVTREVSAEDRRSYSVTLTADGRRKFEEIASVHEAWVIEQFAVLRASERSTLSNLLGTLRKRRGSPSARSQDSASLAKPPARKKRTAQLPHTSR